MEFKRSSKVSESNDKVLNLKLRAAANLNGRDFDASVQRNTAKDEDALAESARS